MARIRNYLSLVVFAHTVFAMPFALTGFFLATEYSGFPFKWTTLLLVLLCMIFARNAAMGFNRWADRHIDSRNPRTTSREIPSGIISGKAALVFSILNGIFFIVTTGFLNPLCLYLSPVALAVILGYSYAKRFTVLCHLILGLGLSLAPIGAYIAVAGQFHWLPLLFSGVVLTWVGGFDVIYALQDEEFDKSNRLHSIPSRVGIKRALTWSVLFHFITFSLLTIIGITARFGFFFWIGAALFILLLTYQHRIVKPDNLSRVNRAFGTTNGIASVIFALFMMAELLIR
ncbi:MAG: 4-hydroxybenzoate octaprenyltransferase [Bacteroidetes bacterium GWF2_49_14]|nr:MAG: 4-hydroxybenzoate octaprenyltransferase [Bacteroidetes bacterium GWF2_49_14]HBB90867.1 4-hydroxybenzoate octaprenyltransferase [Bacteroidales bacterium]